MLGRAFCGEKKRRKFPCGARRLRYSRPRSPWGARAERYHPPLYAIIRHGAGTQGGAVARGNRRTPHTCRLTPQSTQGSGCTQAGCARHPSTGPDKEVCREVCKNPDGDGVVRRAGRGRGPADGRAGRPGEGQQGPPGGSQETLRRAQVRRGAQAAGADRPREPGLLREGGVRQPDREVEESGRPEAGGRGRLRRGQGRAHEGSARHGRHETQPGGRQSVPGRRQARDRQGPPGGGEGQAQVRRGRGEGAPGVRQGGRQGGQGRRRQGRAREGPGPGRRPRLGRSQGPGRRREGPGRPGRETRRGRGCQTRGEAR